LRRVVRASGAEILNCVSTAELDGYLLSESSLFVWEERLLLITCGQTTPVRTLPEILEFIDRDRIAFLFYERKNLNFPD
jgi:S-adenosylmethionine decarboxylase